MKRKKIQLMKPWITEDEYLAVKKVLESGYLTDGPVTREFEAGFNQVIGSKHSVATTSCATALELALRVLKIGPGDEVIVPDYTHPATADVVCMVGATPVLVDVDHKSYNINFKLVEEAITDKTKAIIPVSLFGNPLNPANIKKIKDNHNVFVVEDAACSAGASYNGVNTGVMSDITCFSFHPRKAITTGEGGMLTTQNDDWYNLAKKVKHFGGEIIPGTKIFRFPYLGTNYKFPNILAAVGVEQLKKIDTIIKKRCEKAEIYKKLLSSVSGIKTPVAEEGAKHIYQSFACVLDKGIDRNALIIKLKELGIETQIATYCLHVQPYFKKTARMIGDLKNSEELFNRSIVLPIHNFLTGEEQEYVVEKLKENMD